MRRRAATTRPSTRSFLSRHVIRTVQQPPSIPQNSASPTETSSKNFSPTAPFRIQHHNPRKPLRLRGKASEASLRRTKKDLTNHEHLHRGRPASSYSAARFQIVSA